MMQTVPLMDPLELSRAGGTMNARSFPPHSPCQTPILEAELAPKKTSFTSLTRKKAKPANCGKSHHLSPDVETFKHYPLSATLVGNIMIQL